ncbi:uncharacterized protein LOC118106660 isoform X2 [Hippoglossus stenolepis]|uniref:uncharacterized protein LOC118106660 isoform X2 n=1 Tax=Hippoglossus stenolepis TaxID=195615 RepID=UPI00159C865E|nr:uncharacterized protein LOC118106660 isoform X2 [Hippoglossus stenolepis]
MRKFSCQSFSFREEARQHTMASSSTKRHLSNRGPSLLLLALVCTVTFSLTESAEPIPLRGEVGGNVTFQCPVDNHRTISFFYFQHGDLFLNGYHAKKEIDSPMWENTRLDRNRTHVHMCRLNISHTGMYKCIIQYNDHSITESVIQLTVTASYSKPNVTQSCDGVRCFVTCAFYGGYPGRKVAWEVHGSRNTNSQLWNVENNTQVPSPSTMLVNSTSTVYFNCSHGEMGNLSCSVGNVTSNWFSVCKPDVKPTPNSPIKTIAAAVCAGLCLLLVGVLAQFCRRKKRQTGQDGVENGNKEELNDLNKGGKEAF